MNFIGHLAVGLVWWALLLPLFLLLATPVILLLAIRGEGAYFRKVGKRGAGVIRFWEENAWTLAP